MHIIIQNSLITILIFFAAILGFVLNKIDFKGALTGAILAMMLFWFGGGLESLVALFLFFLLGSYASSWKKDIKTQYKIIQENHGERGISNVIANGGIAGLLSILALVLKDHQSTIVLMIIASIATACSDTLSSELGNIYGKKYFNITNLKRSKRGLDGVISITGLWFGFMGSFAIALGTFVFNHDMKKLLIVTVSGFMGNLVDSVLGGTLQQKGYINNHQVNFLATFSGALICLLLFLLFLKS